MQFHVYNHKRNVTLLVDVSKIPGTESPRVARLAARKAVASQLGVEAAARCKLLTAVGGDIQGGELRLEDGAYFEPSFMRRRQRAAVALLRV